MAESILHDFYELLPGGVTLEPGTGGIFEVSLDGDLVYSKRATSRFPDDGEVEAALDQKLHPE